MSGEVSAPEPIIVAGGLPLTVAAMRWAMAAGWLR